MTTTDPAAGSPDAPGAPAPETTPQAGAPETATEVDPFAPIEGEPDTFPRDYVEKLRREGGGYRTKLRTAEEQIEALAPVAGLFDGWEPEQVEGWRTFLSTAQQDPGTALAAMLTEGFGLTDREAAEAALAAIYGDDAPGSLPETPPADDRDRPMTRAEYEAERQREAEEAALQTELANLNSEAKELGYDPDAQVGTPDEFRYQRLLYLTAHNGGDTKKAHDALVAEEQAIVKRHLDSLAEQANGLPSVHGNNGGAGVPVGDQPKTFADADKRADEWLRSSAAT